jgi:hypothetical protein
MASRGGRCWNAVLGRGKGITRRPHHAEAAEERGGLRG